MHRMSNSWVGRLVLCQASVHHLNGCRVMLHHLSFFILEVGHQMSNVPNSWAGGKFYFLSRVLALLLELRPKFLRYVLKLDAEAWHHKDLGVKGRLPSEPQLICNTQ